MKNTKRALLLSALAIVMSVAMLIGSTFAWFTDSASTAVNSIVSGTLDVAIEKADGANLEGTTLNFVAKDGNTNVLWEPNATFDTEEFYIVNKGNLNLKFKFDLIGATGDTELLDVISFIAKYNDGTNDVDVLGRDIVLAPNAKFGPVVINGHMDKDAGNKYQGLTVNGLAINVVATQATVENDSIGNTYDADAKYPVIVEDKAELTAALAAGNSAVLAADVVADGNLSLKDNATIYGNGYTLKDVQLYMGDNSALVNVAFDGTEAANGSNVYAHDVSVVIEDCTFDNANWEAIQYTTKVANTTITINNCTFKNTKATPAYRYVHIEVLDEPAGAPLRDDANNGVKVILTNNYFENIDTCTDDGITVAGVLKENVTVLGNAATAESIDAANAECWFGDHVSGGWTQYNVTVFEDIYTAIVSTQAELQDALDEAVDGDVISLATDIEGTFKIEQKAGTEVVIKGNGNTLTGFVTIDGGSSAPATAGVVFENLKFVADDASAFGEKACIRLGEKGNSDTRYTNNVTIKNCYFDINDRKVAAIESYTGGDKNLTIIDCTVTSRMHSFLQIPNVNGLVIDNCKIYSKNGINLNSSSNVEIKNCEIKTNGYCVRIGATSGGDSGKVTLTKNHLENDYTERDAVIIVRSAAIENVELVVTGNTIVGTEFTKGIAATTNYTESGNTWITR